MCRLLFFSFVYVLTVQLLKLCFLRLPYYNEAYGIFLNETGDLNSENQKKRKAQELKYYVWGHVPQSKLWNKAEKQALSAGSLNYGKKSNSFIYFSRFK